MSEHLHHQEIPTLKERQFFDPPREAREVSNGSLRAAARQRPTELDREALKRRSARLNARKAELGVPSITELKQSESHVLLGATVLVQETEDGRQLTLLDPKMGLDEKILDELPNKLAPQSPHPIAPMSFERPGTSRRLLLSVAHEAESEVIDRLSGRSVLTPANHLGRLMINGKQLSPKAGELVAVGIAHLGRGGVDSLVQHLTAHESGLRLARR